MKRLPLATGRTLYRVHRPNWPLKVVQEAAFIGGASVCGAGVITLGLQWLGLLG